MRLARARLYLQALGLGTVSSSHPLDLPYVLIKRVALAATLAMGSGWIIIDEPTLGQDAIAASAIAQILCSLAAQGVGVIVITHSAEFRNTLDGIELAVSRGTISTSM